MVEHRPFKPVVLGSSPRRLTPYLASFSTASCMPLAGVPIIARWEQNVGRSTWKLPFATRFAPTPGARLACLQLAGLPLGAPPLCRDRPPRSSRLRA